MTAARQPKWTVTSQRETMDLDNTGQATAGWQVSFTTDTGQSGSVFVPNAIYTNVDAVKAMIQQKVDNIIGVAGLTG